MMRMHGQKHLRKWPLASKLVTLEHGPYRRPKKTTSDISYPGIRIRLKLEGKTRDLALFNMAVDKPQGCDLVEFKVPDVAYGSSVSGRATVLRQTTGNPEPEAELHLYRLIPGHRTDCMSLISYRKSVYHPVYK